MSLKVRGVRGAITTTSNTAESIFEATRTLMQALIETNEMDPEDVCSVLLTMTPDLTADFPARAIRSIRGWELVPLMCAVEVAVPGAMGHCIRVLVHVQTMQSQCEIQHVYLRDAVSLRPDLHADGHTSQTHDRIDES